VQLEAITQNELTIQYFKKAWRANIVKKLTVSEIEAQLGYKVEIISE